MRQSLSMSRGDMTIFLTRPVSLTLLVIAVLTIAYPIVSAARVTWLSRPVGTRCSLAPMLKR